MMNVNRHYCNIKKHNKKKRGLANRFAISASVMSALLLVSCGGERDNDPPETTQSNFDAVIQDRVDNQIIPLQQQLTQSATALSLSATTFCANPTSAGLTGLQSQWKTLHQDWYKLAVFMMGPLNNDPVFPAFTFIDSMRLRGRDYTGTIRQDIASAVSSTQTLNRAFFDNQTFQHVGINALEVVLFDSANPSLTNGSASDSQRKCNYLTGLSQSLVSRLTTVANQWPAYRTQLLSSALPDGSKPFPTLLNTIQAHLEYLQARQISINGSPLANNAWNALSASIDTVDAFLNSGTISVTGLLRGVNATLAIEKINANITEIRTQITNRNSDLLDIALGKLDGNFKREIPNALDVELGINFTDGD